MATSQVYDLTAKSIAYVARPKALLEKKRARISAKHAAANTFEAVAREWLVKCERDGLAPVTIEKISWLLDKAYPMIGNIPIAQITPHEALAVRGHAEPCRGRARRQAARAIRQARRGSSGMGGLRTGPCRSSRDATALCPHAPRTLRSIRKWHRPIVGLIAPASDASVADASRLRVSAFRFSNLTRVHPPVQSPSSIEVPVDQRSSVCSRKKSASSVIVVTDRVVALPSSQAP